MNIAPNMEGRFVEHNGIKQYVIHDRKKGELLNPYSSFDKKSMNGR